MSELVLSLKESKGPFTHDLRISSDATGLQLKQEIATLSSIPVDGQKLLACGKFIKNDATLAEQGIKTNTKILVIKEAAPDQKQAVAAISQPSAVDRMAQAALELAKRAIDNDIGNDERVFELVDQNGKPIRLSPEDETGLKVGMALYEKGKTFLKNGDYQTAVEFFSEADRNFSKCNPKFVASVDNYGMLCLDLAWCYYKMQDIKNLQDAQWRLQRATQSLQSSHGKDMERLQAVKGVIGPDLVIYIRLHLLQAILFFYQGRMTSAASYLERAEQEIERLRVDPDAMVALMSMGFSERESRLGLRANRILEGAATFILQRREKKEALLAEERRQAAERRARRRYGKTADGQWIDVNLAKSLPKLGFDAKLVLEALRQTNNNQELAINLLTQSPHLLQVKDKAVDQRAFDAEVQQLQAMGFSASSALGTLRAVSGSLERALELLISGQGVDLPDAADAAAGSSTEPTPADAAVPAKPAETAEERLAKQQAEDDLVEDLATAEEDEDSYLDVQFDEEEQILREFKARVAASM
eukprot:TRINITY_DN6378_c0_g1_i1.p1 TRINITY_DN6378_c0_g1~~TRINITY_DN6378_c0_g1_i1.p1  ORF type:complete len:531 (+),score=95.35 TRINITY_DN6378_c0_g1_i1:1429-3021(+)